MAQAPARELRHDTVVDVTLTGTFGAFWVTSELLKAKLAPSSCRVCARDADGRDTLNPLDRAARDALRWSNPGAADAASYVTAFALSPIVAYGLGGMAAAHDGHARQFGVDALVVTEAVVLAASANQVVKFAVGRERPFVHALTPVQKGSTAHPSDNNLSFFSGHTTLAFSLATASGTVASMRGYRLAPVVWASGLGVAFITGYLRIAADRHYLTDVLAGALVGSAIGISVPLLFHGPAAGGGASPSVSPTALSLGASTVSLAGTF